jgi:hypothetical protein
MVSAENLIQSDSYQCISCFFYVGRISNGLACYAFPEGIPAEILTGAYDHRNPYPGDAGITWREDEGWAKRIGTEDME